MKKSKILVITLTVAMCVCIAFATATNSSAKSYVTEASFVENGLGMHLCMGETCDHENCYDYSFVLVGDTQCLNYHRDVLEGTNYMNGLYQWIVDNEEAKNIQYVMGLGDITQTFKSSTDADSAYVKEWANAKAAISLLDKAGIPYSLVRGNHDITTGLNENFGEGSEYYNDLLAMKVEGKAGIFESGKIENTWRKIEIGSDKYLILTLDWFPTEEAMYWAENVINSNPDYKVIVTTHHFLGSDRTFSDDNEATFPQDQVGDANWGEAVSGGFVAPRTLWDEVLSKYANVEMILCGHIDMDDIQVSQLRGDNGNTVTCMLVDPQTIDQTQLPVGMVAMLYFKENGEQVGVEYISTVRANDNDTATYEYLGTQNQFKLDLEYEDGWTKTDYGYIPTPTYNANTFHIFVDDDGVASTERAYLGSFDKDSWWNALNFVGKFFEKGGYAQKYFKNVTIYMSKDFDATTLSTSDYNSIGKIAGTFELDLGDNTVTLGDTYFLRYYNQNASYEPTVTFKNGNLAMTGSGALTILQSSTPHSNINLNFENLDITYDSSATSKLIANYSGSSKYHSTVDMNVVDCDIDTSSATSAITLFDLKDKYTTNVVNLNMVGGSVAGSTAANTVIFNKNSNDTVTLSKNASDSYMTLSLKESATISDIYTSSDGTNLKFGAGVQRENEEIWDYTLSDTTDTDGKFDVSSETAVFVAFNQDGTRADSHPTWDGAVNTTHASNNRVIVMTQDYTIETKKNISKLKGSLVIDLGGNTLTIPSDGSGLMNAYFNITDSGTTDVLQITFKNGYIKSEYESPMMQFEAGASNVATVYRNFVFDGITFEGNNQMFSFWDKYSYTLDETSGEYVHNSAQKGLTVNATYNNCTFNYSGNKIFALDYTYSKSGTSKPQYKIISNVVINGGAFITSTPVTEADICSKNTVSKYEDTFKFGMYNGEYPEFRFPQGSTEV